VVVISPLVEIRSVSKVYVRGKQKLEVLHHVNLDIGKGDFLALMGPSGSGKTTLLNLIGGLDSPTEGTLTVAEKRIDRLGQSELARWRASNVGFVFQFYNLLPMLSAARNVELPLLLTKLPAAKRRSHAAIALELVGLADRATHKPGELSGGQQQRVAIARSLANNPAIILADEPTGNLDLKTGQEIIDLLRHLNADRGVTIISATHDHKMLDVSDRIFHIRDGQLDKVDTRAELDAVAH